MMTAGAEYKKTLEPSMESRRKVSCIGVMSNDHTSGRMHSIIRAFSGQSAHCCALLRWRARVCQFVRACVRACVRSDLRACVRVRENLVVGDRCRLHRLKRRARVVARSDPASKRYIRRSALLLIAVIPVFVGGGGGGGGGGGDVADGVDACSEGSQPKRRSTKALSSSRLIRSSELRPQHYAGAWRFRC
eukprot:6208196-Pleurochrysis_carterae.AAC.2